MYIFITSSDLSAEDEAVYFERNCGAFPVDILSSRSFQTFEIN